MKRLSLSFIVFIVCTVFIVWVGNAWAHGDISKLPNSVQIMQYRLLLYMSPEDPGPRNELAMALYRTNQLEEAEKELRYILEKDSRNFDALDGLGIVLLKMGRYQDALQYLKKAASVNDQDLMVHVHLSVVYEKLKIPEKSQKELEKARSLTSDPLQLENIEKEFKLVSSR